MQLKSINTPLKGAVFRTSCHRWTWPWHSSLVRAAMEMNTIIQISTSYTGHKSKIQIWYSCQYGVLLPMCRTDSNKNSNSSTAGQYYLLKKPKTPSGSPQYIYIKQSTNVRNVPPYLSHWNITSHAGIVTQTNWR